MDDNFADEDIEIELAPVSVQLANVQQILGQNQESTSSYVDIIKRNLADEPSLAVAVNNLVALKCSKNISDGLRKLDRLKEKNSRAFQLSQELDAKLSQKHKEAIYANRVLLLLHANKMDQARELCAALPGLFPECYSCIASNCCFGEREQSCQMSGLSCATLARFNVEKAKTYEKQLKTLPQLKAVDVDYLEKTSGAKPIESTAAADSWMQEEVKSKEKVKRKRKRKPKYP